MILAAGSWTRYCSQKEKVADLVDFAVVEDSKRCVQVVQVKLGGITLSAEYRRLESRGSRLG